MITPLAGYAWGQCPLGCGLTLALPWRPGEGPWAGQVHPRLVRLVPHGYWPPRGARMLAGLLPGQCIGTRQAVAQVEAPGPYRADLDATAWGLAAAIAEGNPALFEIEEAAHDGGR